MPPKKKGKKKGKKGKKGKKKTGPAPHPQPPAEGTKEYYLDRITQLHSQIDRYKAKQAELEEENINIRIHSQGFESEVAVLARVKADEDYQYADTEFKAKYEEMQEDREYRAVKATMERDTETLRALREKVDALEQEVEEQQDRYNDEVRQVRGQYNETRSALTGERTQLERRLREIDEFREQREGLMARADAMEKRLQQREERHQHTLADIHDKHERDKERYKRDMVEHLRRVAMTFRRDSQRFMPGTTRWTVHENVVVTDQIGKVQDRMAELDANNAELRETCRQRATTIRDMEKREKELAREAYSSGKLVELLTAKSHEQEVVVGEMFIREDMLEEQEDSKHAYQADIATNRKLTVNSRRQQKGNAVKKAGLEKDLGTLRRDVERMETAFKDCVATLTQLQVLPSDMNSHSPLPPPVDQTLKELLRTIDAALDPNSPHTGGRAKEITSSPAYSPSIEQLLLLKRSYRATASAPEDNHKVDAEAQTEHAGKLKPVKKEVNGERKLGPVRPSSRASPQPNAQ